MLDLNSRRDFLQNPYFDKYAEKLIYRIISERRSLEASAKD